MRTIDTKGQQCPAPLIETKRALRETLKGESFNVLTDSRTSMNNISRFLKDNKTEFSIEETEGVWTLTITKNNEELSHHKAEEYCLKEIPHFSKGDFVIVFSSDRMGEGSDELGRLLIVNFIKAIKDLDILPEKLLFYNKGVTLGSDDSPVKDSLDEIEKMGVELLFCATCVKFYSLEEKIRVGTFSNMYEIAQVMSSAGNVVKP